MDNLQDLVAKYKEETVILVIQKLRGVFSPFTGFFDLLKTHGGPVQIFEKLITDHHLQFKVIARMFQSLDTAAEQPEAASSSTRKRTTLSPRLMRNCGKKPRADSADENEKDEESDHPCELGEKPSKARTDIPVTCDWGGPNSGGDKDVSYLLEEDRERKPVQRVNLSFREAVSRSVGPGLRNT